MILIRAFVVWLLIISLETIHGILRGVFLVPAVGDMRSRQIGVFIGSAIILAAALLTIKWIGVKSTSGRLGVGVFWILLTVLFEIALGRLVMNAGWDRISQDYDLSRGGLMLFGLIFMAFSPEIAHRLRNRLKGYCFSP